MVPGTYPISNEEFSRLNNRPISFENIVVDEEILSGAGTLEIQRYGGQGRGDIVVNRWFGEHGDVRRIHLGERPFRHITDKADDLFLDGNFLQG